MRAAPRLAAALLLAAALAAAGALAGERAAPIPPEVFAKRRAALLERLPEGTVVKVSAGEAPEGEHDVDFRVRSDFHYLTGLDEPGAALELGPGVDALILRPRDRMAERWEGPRLTPESGGATALGFSEVRARRGALPETSAPARAAIAAMRLVKDEHEVARLRRAIDITCIALGEVARSCEPGMREYELDALLRYVFRREGAERAGFPSIFGSGPNSCILHYNRNDRTMRAGDLVVCDVGAEFGRYTADVTRTLPVSGTFTAAQRRVYDAVLRAQEAGIAAVRPGARVRDVHAAARRVLEEEGLARHFFHGTSHWLGLDVHDVGDYDTPLAPGMVLTVEPGAYIAEDEIGVRIEDDVLVTEDGCELLSSGMPRRADEIEALMRGRGLGNEPLGPMPVPRKPRTAEF